MTFTFTMDAMPGYTYFDQTKKVLCVIQVIEDSNATEEVLNSVMAHNDDEQEAIKSDDVVPIDSIDNTPTAATYVKVANNATFSATETYYTRTGNVYTADSTVTADNFAEKKSTLYVKKKA